MTAETDLIKLYSHRILALAAEMPRTGRLEAPDASVTRRSPLCGSAVTVDVVVRDGRVADYAQDVKACALGQAAASVIGGAAIGRSRAEVEAGRDALRGMLSGGLVPEAPWEGLAVLEPARDYRNRHASILLAAEALAEAVAQAEAKAA
ncbi:NifU-like protein involved in Fe-S cluster formation [Hasllibacter halocynthiae]|uniref:NifU-like protein involved in Fe-S cluster formation n=1 Tax=Hasllibacter halocynthiae TaxID=595589 RepID=A0A2T0X850_9RHOB|nr:iron-sulfur cluster assembly scaffold protein [Hasllibacter halocynthiae]PRY95106.1 NifU-like protein involved in Fe-S cluster formation [Hasllibacter halocynthiae]